MNVLLNKKKILKSQRELVSIFDTITDPICMVDDKLTVKRLNLAMANIIGLEIKKALGQSCHKVIFNRDNQCDDCFYLNQTRQQGKRGKKTIHTFQGSDDLMYELTVYPYTNPKEKNVIYHFKDVTERIKLESNIENLSDIFEKSYFAKDSELKKARAKFDRIIRYSPIGIVILNTDQKIVTTNSVFRKIFNLPKDETDGKPFLGTIDKKNKDIIRIFLEQVVRTGAYTLEITHVSKSGDEIDLIVIGLLLSVEGEGSDDVIIMIQDNTEQKKTIAALKESEYMTRTLLNATTDLAALLETDGKIIAINEAAARMMGKDPEELIGVFASEFSSGIFEGINDHIIETVVKKGTSVRFINETDSMSLDNSIYPVFDEKGRINRIAFFSHDVTKKKIFIEELIVRETLAAAGRMSLSLSRELTKPILGIKNYLNILLGKFKENKEVGVPIEKTLVELVGVLDLLERMKKFYSIDSIEKSYININDIINDLLPMVESRLRENNISIKKELSKKLLPIHISPMRVQQAILHLINNADNAMSRGGLLTITTQKRSDKVQVIIEDQGKGMDKKTLDAIKDPHFMGQGNKVSLGLYICKDIMAKHEGTIDVSSIKGEGTRVTLSFPIQEENKPS